MKPVHRPHGSSRFEFAAFWGAYLMFGSLGVLTSLLCFPLSLVLQASRVRRGAQRFIHYLFRLFVSYMQRTGLLRLDASELADLKESRSLILVANHPGLLDAVFVISQLPYVFCLMKGNLVHNIVLNGQSRLAGYVSNQSGPGLIHACHSRLKEGSNLLIFPEGTRSRGGLNPFKMGFALLAKEAQAPVQTLFIRMNSDFLGKGWPFFKRPILPLVCSIKLGGRFEPTPETETRVFGRLVEVHLREGLEPAPAPVELQV